MRILLATDAASEGIDLQRHCHRLIQYEIPWNPNRLEQRNGRIDRHGQRHNPLIYHFAPGGVKKSDFLEKSDFSELEWDMEFLSRVREKVEQTGEDLSKVGSVIAGQVSEAMLGQRRRLDTQMAESAAEPVRKMLKFKRGLNACIAKLEEQLQETRQALCLLPENVRDLDHIALELAGQPPLTEATLEGVWPDPAGQGTECPVFHAPPLRGSWTRSLEGLAHPHTGQIRPIAFDHDLARGRDDVVLAHLNHPLVQLSLRLLRAEIWRTGGSSHLHRVTARLIPSQVLDTPVVVVHARLLMIGASGHRLHEERVSVGGEIRNGRFRRLGVTRVDELLGVELDAQPSPAMQARRLAVWPSIQTALEKALDVRGRERTTSLQRKLAERADKETAGMAAILAELAQTIRQELGEPEYQQLSLFFTTEREQYRRNVAALRARQEQLPDELAREQAAIRARYADPEPRLFPVAVAFLLPQRLAGG